MSTAPAAPLPPGSTLGAYLILEFVAAGGMGMVYKARHRVTNELRALKVILPEFAADELFVARFLREVKIAAAVEHANLVETYEPGMEGRSSSCRWSF
jgi:serine/threonine protein kinase